MPKALEDVQGAVLPFQYEPPIRPFIIIQAQLNGSEPLLLEVDTGSPYSLMLAPWAAKQLGLKPARKPDLFLTPHGAPKITLMAGGKLQFRHTARSQPMEIDMDEIAVADFSFFHDYLGPKIAGVLGGEFFRLFTSRFDFDKKTLTFFAANHPPIKPLPGAIVSPLELPAGDGFEHVTLPLTPKTSVRYVLDTGSDNVIIPKAALQQITPLAKGPTARRFTFAGTSTAENLLLEKFEVGSESTPLLPVISSESPGDALLGLSFLSRYRVTIDPVHKQFLLEPGRPTAIRWKGDLGLRLNAADRKIYISQIISAEATQAGLHAHDEVLSIDGQQLADLPFNQIIQLADGEAGTFAEMTVRQQDNTQSMVHLLRRSAYPNVFRNALGLIVDKQPTGAWRVAWVQPDSAADRAGLHSGDQLFAINDQPVANLTSSRIEEALADAEQGETPLKTLEFQQQKDGHHLTLTR